MKAQLMGMELIAALLLMLISGCAESESSSHQNLIIPKGTFMGIEATDTPTLLFPDFINTPLGEYNGTFNPEGSMFFYTTSIPGYDAIVYTTMQKDSSWSAPAFAPFAATYPEFDPIFSPSGSKLYFSSHRPIADSISNSPSNIWWVEQGDAGWSAPEYLPLGGPAQGNYYSSLTSGGKIYFNIWNTGDMFVASPSDTGYVVSDLGKVLNSPQGDGDPFVAADESYLIFRSYRPGGIGNGDFWISFQRDGEWTEPVNPGEPINSEANEMCPYVTTDGQLFIFSSNRLEKTYYEAGPENLSDVVHKHGTLDNGQQNIYAISTGFIEEMRKRAIESTLPVDIEIQ